MRLMLSLGLVPVYASIVTMLSLNPSSCGAGDDDDASSSSGSRLLVGASTVTLLPTVNGSTSYFDELQASPLALEPGDPGDNPGVYVQEWDVGTIAIGNGESSSHWVHDEIRATAIAFKDLDQPDGQTLVMVTADVYMLFRQDIQTLYDKVQRAIGPEAFKKLTILVSATHNHMGPDTSGMDGINPDYYEYMTDQISQAIQTALSSELPAQLKVTSDQYQFGLADSTAPYITDPTLGVMQAVSTEDGHVIATLMQWQNHPEDTLGFGKDIYATPEQADYLRSVGECISNDDQAHCNINGQYISAGFAGYAVRRVMEDTNAPAGYFNGPVGSMMSPLHDTVWETEGPQGIPVTGLGVDIPAGAVLIPKNFHKLAVDGNELGKRVQKVLKTAELVSDPPIRIFKAEGYTRLTNLIFRIGMDVLPSGKPAVLGYQKRELFTCPDVGVKDDTTCVSDRYQSDPDPILRVPVRRGTFGKSEGYYVKIGPVGMLTIPGEAVVEIVQGLPSDFMTDPRSAYYVNDRNRYNHVAAKRYDTNGYVRQAMNDKYKWALGLTQDEMGYMLPISDFRIYCTADEDLLGGTMGMCEALYAAGIIDFVGYSGTNWSISGQRCKEITENPDLLNYPPYTSFSNGAELAKESCYYGQMFGEAEDHYCETNAGGWDLAADWTGMVKQMTSWDGELEDVNPAFIGYNQPPQ